VEVLVRTQRAAPAPRVEDPLNGRSADPAEVGKNCVENAQGRNNYAQLLQWRAQEDSGILEELNTSGIRKKKCYREKEVAAICGSKCVLARWVSQKKECLHVAGVVGNFVAS
jgi:hypothetical protein